MAYFILVPSCLLSAQAIQECIENQLTNSYICSTEPIVAYLSLPYLIKVYFCFTSGFSLISISKRLLP